MERKFCARSRAEVTLSHSVNSSEIRCCGAARTRFSKTFMVRQPQCLNNRKPDDQRQATFGMPRSGVTRQEVGGRAVVNAERSGLRGHRDSLHRDSKADFV